MSGAEARKTALLTGATGFIGSRLARRLVAEGWDVHLITRAGSQTRQIDAVLGKVSRHEHDGSTEQLVEIVGKVRPAVVFHLASVFLAGHAAEDVTRLVRSNIEFPTQLAEAMAVNKVRSLVNTGTAWQHFENQPYNPVNLYAATKQAFVDVARYYAETGSFRVMHLEIFDTYGPEDERPKLFTLLRKTAASGEALEMSAGEQMIDLVYIDDVIDAFVTAAERMEAGRNEAVETYSVSTERPVRLRDMVELWSKTTGRKLNIKWGARAYRPREIMVPWNSGKLVPGWNCRIGLDEGIRRMEGLVRTLAE